MQQHMPTLACHLHVQVVLCDLMYVRECKGIQELADESACNASLHQKQSRQNSEPTAHILSPSRHDGASRWYTHHSMRVRACGLLAGN